MYKQFYKLLIGLFYELLQLRHDIILNNHKMI
jgi:hypothetical protein